MLRLRVLANRRTAGGSPPPPDPIEFIGTAGTTVPATSVGVHANTIAGDLVVVWGGESAGNLTINFNSEFDLEDGDNGSGVSCGCGYTSSASGSGQTFTHASIHRMRTLTFRNALSVQSVAPTFSASSSSMVFPGFPGGTVPGGGGRVILMGYNTATNGGISSAPAGFTQMSGNGFTPAWISDVVLTTFNGATATLVNGVIQGRITAVVLQ